MQRELTARQITKILKHIKESVPSPPTVSDTIYKKPEHIFDIKQIQEVSNHMGFFLGLLQSVTVITRPKERDQFVVAASGSTKKEKEIVDYSGLYKVCRTGQKNIEIVSNSGFYFRHYLAVIAHETTHNYLFHHSIKPNGFDEEIYTDLAAIYLGFGPLLIDGYEPCEWTDHYKPDKPTHAFQLGYIDVATAKKALVISAKFRGWKTSEVVSQLKGLDKLIFRLGKVTYCFIK